MDFIDLHPTRRTFVRGLVMASGFAPAILAGVARAGANSKVPVIPGVQSLKGSVWINTRPARVGQVVHPGDMVETDAHSDCVIIIGTHVYLVRGRAEVTFYAEDFEQSEDGAVSGAIRLARGAMLSVFGTTKSHIVTPFATIGIRGTACYIDARIASTYACLCYGRALISGTQDGKALETVVTTHHDSPRIIYPVGGAKRIEVANVVDHSDDELRMLEALVNRKPPFDKLGRKGEGY